MIRNALAQGRIWILLSPPSCFPNPNQGHDSDKVRFIEFYEEITPVQMQAREVLLPFPKSSRYLVHLFPTI